LRCRGMAASEMRSCSSRRAAKNARRTVGCKRSDIQNHLESHRCTTYCGFR
jgi:hypothetical protein